MNCNIVSPVPFAPRRPPVHRFHIHYLLIVPILLSVLAALTLTLHGDVNAPLLYSQCHARSRLPAISRVPILGAPACFLVSIWMFATASTEGLFRLSSYFAFLAALLTVSRVEAAREYSKRKWNVRFPTFSWLVFNLVGGTFVWDLWIVPVLIEDAKDMRIENAKRVALETGQENRDEQELVNRTNSMLSLNSEAEVYAIPTAVVIGFLVPSVLMLALQGVVSVIAWLFFPLWVAVVHWVAKFAAAKLLKNTEPHRLSTLDSSVFGVYLVPVAISVAAHATFLMSLFSKDDSRQMTQMALGFIMINFFYLTATVLYWIFVECGASVLFGAIALSLTIGPGAALCIAWIFRDYDVSCRAVRGEPDDSDDEIDGDDSTVHEDTPLLG